MNKIMQSMCRCARWQQQLNSSKRLFSAIAEPAPTSPGSLPPASAAVVELADKIERLTLIEVADLNRLLQERLGVTPAVAVAAAPAAAAASTEDAADASAAAAESAAVKTSFNLKLVKYDAAKKVALIKELKTRNPSLNLVQTKKLVESAPAVVVSDISKDEAETLKKAMEEIGATVEIE